MRALIATGSVTGVHDLSGGGLAVALAEMACLSGCGATVELTTFDGGWTLAGSVRARAALW
jgi:phosphoribosylformylglycinamidine (FGAM) synthase-like enzyme